MTRFSLGREDDGECSVAFLPKRKRVVESEGDGSPELEGERDAFGVDEEEGAGSNRLSVSSSKEERGSLVVALTDPDALDCPICFEPFKAPVFQAYILQEQDRGVLFILRNEVHMLGNVMKIECLAPPSQQQYTYEIVAEANDCSLKLKSNAADKNSMDSSYKIPFLMLPKPVNISGELTFCIRSPD